MKDDKQNESEMGGMCAWCHTGKHMVLRWALGLFILIITFSLGVKIGELKAYLNVDGYGYSQFGGGRSLMNTMMWGGGYDQGNQYYYGPQMMRGWGWSETQQAAPATTTKSK